MKNLTLRIHLTHKIPIILSSKKERKKESNMKDPDITDQKM